MGGSPVLAIDTGAFRNCKYIEVVAVGEGIQEIRSGAFQNCPKLQELHIPNSVQTIGENLFVNDGDGAADKNVNITLYCYSGSYGMEYARKNRFAYKKAMKK